LYAGAGRSSSGWIRREGPVDYVNGEAVTAREVDAAGGAPGAPGAADRAWAALLIASTLCLSWLLFMVLHEFGHCLGAWLTGGEVRRVSLGPLVISETVLGENPRPLVVVWAGPLVGSLLPAGLWLVLRLSGSRRAYLGRFLAGFCLAANGAYIGADAFYRNGDGFVMIAHGTSRWVMVLFGLTALAAGLRLWHRLGPRFGLGPARGRVERRDAAVTAALLALLVALEVLFFR
jgi:hypothetical protein